MKNRMIPLSGILITFILLSACSGTAVIARPVAENTPLQQQAAAPASSVTSRADPLSVYENALENVYSLVNPSVVNIRVVQKQELAASDNPFSGLPFFDMPNLPGFPNIPDIPQEPQNSQGLGSGFVWDQQGYIVTNNHVVDRADKVEVTFSDGTTVPAKVIGTDPDSDLAVIQVDISADQLHPVQLADSTQVKVGQLAIAIGNPFGLQGTMTTGIISALGRMLPASESNSIGPFYSIPDILQTDAPINPGNSGGVLVDDQGRVIGVTSAIRSTSGANAGIGFAIPSALVQKVVPALIESGYYEHPYLGISGTTLTPGLAKAMDLKPAQRGALVEDVTPGGPADKTGLRGSDRQVTIDGQEMRVGGDVIIAIDGSPVKTMDDLIAYLTDQTTVGQKVSLTLLRDRNEKSLEVILEARPQQTENANAKTAAGWLGIQGAPLTPEIARAMKLNEDQQGVLVQQMNLSPSPST